MIKQFVDRVLKGLNNAKKDYAVRLPDGSAFALMSSPLPANHWIYGDPSMERSGEWGSYEPPPMPFRMGCNDPRRQKLEEKIEKAARYAVRSATMNGRETDFDPDALVQNLMVGLFGYYTIDALSSDFWANPEIDNSDQTELEL